MIARRHVVFFQQVENFFFAGFGVQVDELVLFGGGGDEIFQDFSLRRISRSIFDPVKVEADLADGGARFDVTADFMQSIRIFGGAAGMNTESRQNEIRAFGDFLQLQIRRHVHRCRDGEDALGFDLFQSLIEQLAVFIQVDVSIDKHV